MPRSPTFPGPYRVRPGHAPELYMGEALPPHIVYRGHSTQHAGGLRAGKPISASYMATAKKVASLTGTFRPGDICCPDGAYTRSAVDDWLQRARANGHIKRVRRGVYLWIGGDVSEMKVTRAA